MDFVGIQFIFVRLVYPFLLFELWVWGLYFDVIPSQIEVSNVLLQFKRKRQKKEVPEDQQVVFKM